MKTIFVLIALYSQPIHVEISDTYKSEADCQDYASGNATVDHMIAAPKDRPEYHCIKLSVPTNGEDLL